MDIQYLLLLQHFREATNEVFTPALWALSEFIKGMVPLMTTALIYWVFSKRIGGWIMLNFVTSYWLNGIIKLTACVYRPWIRDARIIPAGNSMSTATGYSFPSGHTMTAVPYYGCGAVCCWKNKKSRVLSVIFVILLLLTMFSRNYLGVHTPQDVLVGLIASLIVLAVSVPIYRRMQSGDEKQAVHILIIGLAVVVLSVLYVTLKPYPMDYVNGVLLVDPEKMKPDCYNGIGGLLGAIVGWYLEKRYIGFVNPSDKRKGVLIALPGLALIALWLWFIINIAPPMIGTAAAKALRLSVTYLFIFAGMPFVFKKLT